ncbi:MAG: hypothetical protein CVU98_07145 [Firmicutes bacterium HGW-Firmicutes-3]|jgi:hypothetical protein|nr:MAG: hypothetical protein CVU98_07145 [Firmicutes bacterium HGW-Firmicutes-3]
MKPTKCKNGHIFDDSKFLDCPYCSGAMINEDNKTVSIFQDPIDNNNSRFMKTCVQNEHTPVTNNIEDTSKKSHLTSKPTQGSHTIAVDECLKDNAISKNVYSSDDKTILQTEVKYQLEEHNHNSTSRTTNLEIETVHGWVVAINGVNRGKIFRLSSIKNCIGRNQNYEVPLMNDRAVSRKQCAHIDWDLETKMHSFVSTDLGGLVYYNKRVLLDTVILKEYDLLTVGETELLFVPLYNEG